MHPVTVTLEESLYKLKLSVAKCQACGADNLLTTVQLRADVVACLLVDLHIQYKCICACALVLPLEGHCHVWYGCQSVS